MPTAPYTFRMDADLREALEREARIEGLPPAHLAALAVRSLVETREAKRRAIDAALAEAGEGRFISEAAMNAWMNSWGEDDEAPMPEPDMSPDAA